MFEIGKINAQQTGSQVYLMRLLYYIYCCLILTGQDFIYIKAEN
ncbi:MAG: hypothetical protein ACFWTN_12835 [Clostridium sp.]|jgi:hypothetical protein